MGTFTGSPAAADGPAGAAAAARLAPRVAGSRMSVVEQRFWGEYLDSVDRVVGRPLAVQRGMVLLELRARLGQNLSALVAAGVRMAPALRARAEGLLTRIDRLFARVVARQPKALSEPESPVRPSSDLLRATSSPVLAEAAPAPKHDADISEAELDDGGPAVDIVLPPAPADSLLRWPLARVRVTSSFGRRRDPIHGRKSFHDGIDLSARRGTPVLAAAGGRVTFAGRRGAGGNVVVIAHAMGIKTVYAHLDAFLVRAGSWIQPGHAIGVVGSTGRSTGPHLHFVVRMGGRSVDPIGVVGRSVVAVR